MELLQERKQAALRHERELRAKDAEVLRMQQYIDADLRHLQQRQEEVRQPCCLHACGGGAMRLEAGHVRASPHRRCTPPR